MENLCLSSFEFRFSSSNLQAEVKYPFFGHSLFQTLFRMATIDVSPPPLLHFTDSLVILPKVPISFPSIHASPLFPSISLRHTSIKPRSLIIASALKNLSEVETVPFPVTPEEFDAKFPPDSGVYAFFDKKDELQFIGISCNSAGCWVLAAFLLIKNQCRSFAPPLRYL